MPIPVPLVGRVLGGRYRLEERIGEGGFGEVYRATHLDLGTSVAIKVAFHDRPDLLARFRREAVAQERLEIRYVVRVRDFGREPDGLHYLVQNLVNGRTLLQVIEEHGVIEPRRAIELCRQICLALEEAHANDIVHRDIKPANVMVVDTPRGEEIRLLDFGIAKLLDAATEGLTQTGAVFGTVAYMAPEQVQGRPPLPQTDLYAVGGVLYHALVGHYPYLGELRAVAMQHLLAPPPELPDHMPDALSRLVRRAMAKDPAERFADAAEMAEALARCGDALKGAAPPSAPAAADETTEATMVSGPMHPTGLDTTPVALASIVSPASSPDLGSPASSPDPGAPASSPDLGSPASSPHLGSPASSPHLGAPVSSPGPGSPVSSPALGSPAPESATPRAAGGPVTLSAQQSWRGEIGAPAPEPRPRRRRWGWGVAGAAVLALVLVLSTRGPGADPSASASADDVPSRLTITSSPGTPRHSPVTAGDAVDASARPQPRDAAVDAAADAAVDATVDAAPADAGTKAGSPPKSGKRRRRAPRPPRRKPPPAPPVDPAPPLADATRRAAEADDESTPTGGDPEQRARANDLLDAMQDFEEAIDACRCEDAEAALIRIANVHRGIASPRQTTFVRKCRSDLPGNCR